MIINLAKLFCCQLTLPIMMASPGRWIMQMEAIVHFKCPPLNNPWYNRFMSNGNLLVEEVDLAPVHNPVLEGVYDV